MAELQTSLLITDPGKLGQGNLSVATLTDSYEPWLGPLPMDINRDYFATSNRPQHIRNMPENYRGRNVTLLTFIEEQVFFNDQYLSQVILPLREDENVRWEWNTWKFNAHLMQPVPYQSVSRYITSETSSGQKGTVRYGIAFTLEHGFMKTQAGRMNYFYNLRTIANSVNETHNFDILRCILSQSLEVENFAASRGYYAGKSFHDIMVAEKNQFALLQKNGHTGFQILDAATKERVRFNAGNTDTWLVPPYIQYYIQYVPKENTNASIAGPVGPQRLTTNTYDSPGAFQLFGDARVYFVRMFNYDHHQHVDAMARYRQIGEYNTLLASGAVDTEQYSTNDRNIVIYNEDRDDWHLMTLRDAINNCMRFNEFAENGLTLLKPARGKLTNEGYRKDPFFMPIRPSSGLAPMDDDMDGDDGRSIQWKPIEIFGQMKGKDLDPSVQADTAKTILRHVKSLVDIGSERTLESLLSMFDTINSTAWSSRAELVEWYKAITGRVEKAAATSSAGSAAASISDANYVLVRPGADRAQQFAAVPHMPYDLNKGYSLNSDRGVPDVPSNIGQSNWFGLRQMDDNANDDTYSSSLALVSALTKQLQRLLPGCLLTDKTRTPGHFPVAAAEEVFMENALGLGGFPVWINAKANLGLLDKYRTRDSKSDYTPGDEDGDLSPIIADDENTRGRVYAAAKKMGVPAASMPPTGATVAASPSFEAGDMAAKEANRVNLIINQLSNPLFPIASNKVGLVSFESLQRYKNYITILNHLDIAALQSGMTGGRTLEFFTSLRNKITTFWTVHGFPTGDPFANAGQLNQLKANLPSTMEVDNIIYTWAREAANNGFLTTPYPGMTGLEFLPSLIESFKASIQVAAKLDRLYVSKNIPPFYGITGRLSENFVKTHTNAECLKEINKSKNPASPGVYPVAKFGGRYGSPDSSTYADEYETTTSGLASASWVRTTYSLSAYQVSRLYELQYQSTGDVPMNLVAVSFPDAPESIATPAQLSKFTDTYRRTRGGDFSNLPKDRLTGIMLDDDQKMRYIEFTTFYGNAPSSDAVRGRMNFGGASSLFKKRDAGARAFTDLAYDEEDTTGYGMVGDYSKRQKQTERAFGAVTGTDLSLRTPGATRTGGADGRNPLLTAELTKHWEDIARQGQPTIIKAIMRSLLMTPFSKECLLNLEASNCVVPVGFLLFAHHMTYQTLLAINILAGDRTGNLYVGHRDFELGSNIKTKVFFGHFTMESAPIVHHPQNIAVAYDIFVKACFGGAGVKLWNEKNLKRYNPEVDETYEADRFAVMVSYNEGREGDERPGLRNPMDASGRFSYFNAPGLIDTEEARGFHYSTADYYNQLCGFRKADAFRRHNISALPLFHPYHEKQAFREFNYNTVMWHGAQAGYNRHTRKYDSFKPGSGHWGENGSGIGCRAVRNGESKEFPSMADIRASLHIGA